MRAPKARPCGSCPYRRDVPSGVWHMSEYVKLIPFDRPTAEQPDAVFNCHQQDGHLCAGWVGCHDMQDNLGIRIAAAAGHLSREDYEKVLNYESQVPLWESGMEAALHGLQDIEAPGQKARKVMQNLKRKGLVQGG